MNTHRDMTWMLACFVLVSCANSQIVALTGAQRDERLVEPEAPKALLLPLNGSPVRNR